MSETLDTEAAADDTLLAAPTDNIVATPPEGGSARSVVPAIPSANKLARWRRRLPEIASWEPRFRDMSNEQMRKHSLSLRYRALSGEKLDRMLRQLAWAVVTDHPRSGVKAE